MHAHARTSRNRARKFFIALARVYGSYARVRARIFTKKNLVVKSYLMNLSFKFCQDPSFRWGDIPLFVTVYDLELEIKGESKKTSLNLRNSFCLISPATNMIDGWDIIH